MFIKKVVKYKITGMFGCLQDGDIINAILLLTDSDSKTALIYHPWVRGECPSLEICAYNEKSECWEALHDDCFINIQSHPLKFEKKLLGENFEFKREFYNEHK